MDQDERQERESREFEKGREVHEEQTRNISEEADEEDRRKWEKTRDIRKEVDATSEKADEQHRQLRDDQLEAPPGD